jgi:hypothetical protein
MPIRNKKLGAYYTLNLETSRNIVKRLIAIICYRNPSFPRRFNCTFELRSEDISRPRFHNIYDEMNQIKLARIGVNSIQISIQSMVIEIGKSLDRVTVKESS